MSDTKTRLPLAQAEALAAELVALLSPSCERLTVAGSIRRRRETIGDVELCALPKRVVIPEFDMFGNVVSSPAFDLLAERTDDLLNAGILEHRLDVNGRRAWGQWYRRCTYKGFGVDLFVAPSAAEWAGLLTIRTGGAVFSHRLVTPTTTPIQGGLHGLMPPWAEFKGWRVRHRASGEALDTPTEESVFDALRLPWVEPQDRVDSWQA